MFTVEQLEESNGGEFMKKVLDNILDSDTKVRDRSVEDEVLEPLLLFIDVIQDDGIKQFVRSCLYNAPETFWTQPSSTIPGKNPPDEYGVGGNIKHIQRVCRFAGQIAIAQECDEDEMDLVMASALLHDMAKIITEDDEIVDVYHPYTVKRFIHWVRDKDEKDGIDSASSSLYIMEESLLEIMRIIRCQNGIWSEIPETIPVTTLETIVHLAELLATNVHRMVDGESVSEERWLVNEG